MIVLLALLLAGGVLAWGAVVEERTITINLCGLCGAEVTPDDVDEHLRIEHGQA